MLFIHSALSCKIWNREDSQLSIQISNTSIADCKQANATAMATYMRDVMHSYVLFSCFHKHPSCTTLDNDTERCLANKELNSQGWLLLRCFSSASFAYDEEVWCSQITRSVTPGACPLIHRVHKLSQKNRCRQVIKSHPKALIHYCSVEVSLSIMQIASTHNRNNFRQCHGTDKELNSQDWIHTNLITQLKHNYCNSDTDPVCSIRKLEHHL